MTSIINGKRKADTLHSSGKDEAVESPEKRQKVGGSATGPSLSDDAAAKVLMAIQTNVTSSSSNSKENGLSHSNASPVALIAPSSGTSNVMALRAQGINLVGQIEFTKAIEVFRSAIGEKGTPSDVQADLFFRLGRARRGRGLPEDRVCLVDNLLAALSIGSLGALEKTMAYLDLSRAYLLAGSNKDYERAMICAQEGLKIATEMGYKELQAKLHSNLGMVYYRNGAGDLSRSIETLRKALAVDQPNQEERARFLRNLAIAYIRRNADGDSRAAAVCCQEGLQLNHENALLKAELYEKFVKLLIGPEKDLNRAVRNAREALQLNDKHNDNCLKARLYISLGFALRERGANGDLSTALDAFNAAALLGHHNDQVKLEILSGQIALLMDRGRPEDERTALVLLRKTELLVHRMNIENRCALFQNLAFLLHKHGDFSETIKYWDLALKSPPLNDREKAYICNGYGYALAQRNLPGDLEQALKLFQLGASLEQPDAVLRTWLFKHLGHVYQKRNQEGDLSRAIESFRAGSALEHNDPSVRIGISTCLIEAVALRNEPGDLAIFIDLLVKLVTKDARNVEPKVAFDWYKRLTGALGNRREQGDLSRAIEHYKAAVAFFENQPGFKANILVWFGRDLIERAGNGDLLLAIDTLNKALGMYAQEPLAAANCLKLLGSAYLKKGTPSDLEQAANFFAEGLKRLDDPTSGLKDELTNGLIAVFHKKGMNVLPSLKL